MPTGFIKPVFGWYELVKDSEGVEYIDTVKDGFAVKAGVPGSGYIRSIEGRRVNLYTDVSKFLQSYTGHEVVINICINAELTDCSDFNVNVNDKGIIGIILKPNAHYILSYSSIAKPFGGFLYSVDWVRFAYIGISSVFQNAKETGDYSEVSATVSTPIMLYAVVDKIKGFGVPALALLVADISMSLMIMNLLPIPALDGGRVMLLCVEKLLGGKYSKSVEKKIITISFVVLLMFMVAILVKDILMFGKLHSLL